MTSSNMYYFTSVLMSLFVTADANPPTGQTFENIGQMADFWTVCNAVDIISRPATKLSSFEHLVRKWTHAAGAVLGTMVQQ